MAKTEGPHGGSDESELSHPSPPKGTPVPILSSLPALFLARKQAGSENQHACDGNQKPEHEERRAERRVCRRRPTESLLQAQEIRAAFVTSAQ